MAGFISVVSIVCLLVAAIMLLNLIQKAFDRDGVRWGLISMVYPPGTYLFCRKNWDTYRKNFLIITSLTIIGLILFFLVKIFT